MYFEMDEPGELMNSESFRSSIKEEIELVMLNQNKTKFIPSIDGQSFID
jgi:hypothetical protein